MAVLQLLPADLLTLIVEQCIALSPDHQNETLKQLRLVHRSFTHNKFLNRQLFSSLIFTSEAYPPEDDLEDIASYAHKIIFRHEDVLDRKPAAYRRLGFFDEPRTSLEEQIHDTLTLLPNVRHVTISNAYPGGYGASNMHTTRGPWAPDMDDQLLQYVVEGINESLYELQVLHIEHVPTLQFNWNRCPAFHRLDLSHLTTLHFHPYTLPRKLLWLAQRMKKHHISPSFESGEEPDTTLTSILHKCAPTLKELSIRCDGLYFTKSWQSHPPPTLPSLTSFSIENGQTALVRVLPWLRRSPKLEELSFQTVYLDEGRDMSAWQPLLDFAHEDRPTPIRLRLTVPENQPFPPEFPVAYYTASYGSLKDPLEVASGVPLEDYLANLRDEVVKRHIKKG